GPYSPEGLALNEPIWNTSGQPLYGATPEESPGSQPNVEIENAAAPVKSEEMEIPKYPKPTQRDDIEPTRHFA
ncbi:MAG TPA: hypothetical protein PKD55_11310, partial [Bellilinea sp.]|nr:hypothetical protein [Bellilinea sp.]